MSKIIRVQTGDIALTAVAGDVVVTTAGTVSILGTGETLATFVDDGAVTLYNDGTARARTAGAGVAFEVDKGSGWEEVLTGENLAVGTVTDSVTRWSGTAWVEETQVRVSAAGVFTILDSGLTDSAAFSHNGTDFVTTFTNTAAWTLSGPLTIALDNSTVAGVYAGFELYSSGDTSSAFWAENDDTSGVSSYAAYNSQSEAYVELAAYGDTQSVVFPAATKLSFTDDTASNANFAFYLHGSSQRRYAKLHRPTTTKFFDIQDATRFRIFDDTEADSVELYHDGTDFNTTFTNTAEWNIVVTLLDLDANLDVDGTTMDIDAATTLALHGGSADITLAGTEVDLTATTLDFNGNLDLDGTTHTLDGTTITVDAVTTLNLAGGSATATLTGTDIDLTATNVDVNGTLRVYDAGLTDIAAFDHDGTDFNTVFTNTRWWEVGQLEEFFVTGKTANNLGIGANANAAATGNFAYLYALHNDNGSYVELSASGSTIVGGDVHALYFSSDVGKFEIIGDDGAFMTFTTAATDELITVPARIVTAASTTTRAGLNLPHGTAPSAPVNGDTWTTTAGIYARINGTTYELTGAVPTVGELRIDTTVVAFNSVSPIALFTTPTNCMIKDVTVIIDTPFDDAAATLSVGVNGGSATKYMTTAQNVLDDVATSVYTATNGNPAASAEALEAYLTDAAAAGSVRVIVTYYVES